MKGMIRQELKNYFKNPLYWVGILFILYGLFQILSPYLDVHYFHSKQEVQQTKPESLADADIMDGYVKSTEKERIDLAAKKIQSMIVKEFGEDAENVRETLKEIRESGKSVSEMSDAIEEIYGYPKGYSFQYYYQVYEYHKGTKNEINKDLKEKLTAHSYSWYFGRKFADFGGLYLGFFSAVLLAFLFIRDTKRDTYELLHTKPVTAKAYVFGKATGGFLSMAAAWLLFVVVFFALSAVAGIRNGLPVSLIEFLIPAVCYMLPNVLMIVSVYTIIALGFRNPLPGVPFLFLYLMYSNMGPLRPLAITVRFDGGFLEAVAPRAVYNQVFLLVVSAGLLFMASAIWKRRRIG